MSLRKVHLKLAAMRPPGDHNVRPVTVIRSVFLGDMTQIHVRLGPREMIVRQTGPSPVGDGLQGFLSVAPEHCVLLDAS
jgi:hypothetical protein